MDLSNDIPDYLERIANIEGALQEEGIFSAVWSVWDHFTRLMVWSGNLDEAKQVVDRMKT